MAETIIPLSEFSESGEASAWEEHIFQAACAWGKAQAEALLRSWDDKLLEGKPAGWRMEGFRERTVMTRFGEMQIRRRLYRDEQGCGNLFSIRSIGTIVGQQNHHLILCMFRLRKQNRYDVTGETRLPGFELMSLCFTALKANKIGCAGFISRSMVTD